MKHSNQIGFTLIELLVVITIIGILATGATQVYTSQIQKARDTTRINDITTVKGGLEQFYQDDGVYPDKGAAFSGVSIYVQKSPQDPKSGNAGNSAFEYLYNVSQDSNTIPNQEYEVSTYFEQQGNIDKKAATDGGQDNNRLEIGINISDTQHPTSASAAITGNKYECVTPSGGATSAGNCSTAANPMVIKN